MLHPYRAWVARVPWRPAAVAVVVAVLPWAVAQETFRIALGQSAAGVVAAVQTHHLYLLDVPPGTSHLSVGVNAFGDDADLAVYFGAERTEVFSDLSPDPYPLFTLAAPPPGRYEIEVLNLLWQDLRYELHVAGSASIAGFPPVDRPRGPVPSGPGTPQPVAPPVPVPPPPVAGVVPVPVLDASSLWVDVVVAPRTPVVVRFDRAPADRDWVGMYRVGAGEREYLAWQWTDGRASGALTFEAPVEAGVYEFRLFDRGAFERVATSATFEVRAGPASGSEGPTLRTPSAVVPPGSEVVATFAGTPGNARDWVGLFRTDADDRRWIAFQYTGGAIAGDLRFAAPAETGSYEFRLFANDGWNLLAVGGAFEVRPPAPIAPTRPQMTLARATFAPGESILVEFAAAPRNRDWIGLYRVGTDDLQHITWQGTNDVELGSLTFVAPTEPGAYEFRMFVGWGYERVAISPRFDVR